MTLGTSQCCRCCMNVFIVNCTKPYRWIRFSVYFIDSLVMHVQYFILHYYKAWWDCILLFHEMVRNGHSTSSLKSPQSQNFLFTVVTNTMCMFNKNQSGVNVSIVYRLQPILGILPRHQLPAIAHSRYSQFERHVGCLLTARHSPPRKYDGKREYITLKYLKICIWHYRTSSMLNKLTKR